MLIELDFPYFLEFKVKNGRLARTEWIRTSEHFNPQDIADGDAVPAVRIDETAGFVPNPSPVIRDKEGWLWPVQADLRKAAVDPLAWVEGHKTVDGIFTAWAGPYGDLLDTEGLTDAVIAARKQSGFNVLYNMHYPSELPRTFEEAKAHKLIHDTRELCHLHVASRVAQLAIWKGGLYRRGGEPAIVLDLSDRRAEPTVVDSATLTDGILDAEVVGPKRERTTRRHLRTMRAGRTPFLDYEVFRGDRMEDAQRRASEIAANHEAGGPGCEFAVPKSVVPCVLLRIAERTEFSFDATGFMMREAAKEVGSFLLQDAAPSRAKVGPLSPLIVRTRAAQRAFSASMEGFRVPEGGGIRGISAAFDEMVDRLEQAPDRAGGPDLIMNANGKGHRAMTEMAVRASSRARRDLASGVVLPLELAEEDDFALTALM